MRRWAIVMLAAWIGLTAAAVGLRTRGWSKTTEPDHSTRVRVVLNNTLDTLAAPALGAIYVVRGYNILKTWHGTAMVYGAGYTLPCASVLVLVGLRCRLRDGDRRKAGEKGGSPTDPSRRRVLVNGAASAAGLVLVSAPVYAAAIEPNMIAVRKYRVPIRGLPPALDGLRIVQLSDTHLGPRVHESHVQRAVEIALAQKPDIVALTGDYVHNGPGSIERAAELFAPLVDAPGVMGVVGVLGNHDWYADGRLMSDALRAVGVRMIDNDRVFLDAVPRSLTSAVPADPDQALCLVGLGDLLTDTVEPDRAFAGIPAETARVLLTHVPDTLELPSVRAPDGPRIDLALCGHTHGGQIRMPLIGAPGVPSEYGQRYAGGLIDASVTGTRCPVVVSRGIGVSIVPVRIGVPPEVVVVELFRSGL
ncbi:MAG: metallophosphoesterase [Phycisphaerales bacterium]